MLMQNPILMKHDVCKVSEQLTRLTRHQVEAPRASEGEQCLQEALQRRHIDMNENVRGS